MAEYKPFHDFKVTPKENSQFYTITMDGKELKGVRQLQVSMGVDEIPIVYLVMNAGKVEVEAKDGMVNVLENGGGGVNDDRAG